MSRHWCHLQTLAQSEVESILTTLPEALRPAAKALPVQYAERPDAAFVDDGIDPEVLGLFVGSDIVEPGESPLPPQIILYLENLWDFAEQHEDIYRDEVRTTYLHELGHYLGLGEGELQQRGLE